MSRIRTNWRTQTTKEKCITILVLLMGIIVIVSVMLGLLDVLPQRTANLVLIPAMGVISLINGLAQLKKNRRTGIALLVCAGIILACAAVVIVLSLL